MAHPISFCFLLLPRIYATRYSLILSLRHFRRQAELSHKLVTTERARVKKLEDDLWIKTEAKLRPATEEEKQSVQRKFAKAAAYYKKDSIFTDLQKSFESSEINPTYFRELLKVNFNMHLNAGELDAAVKMFDSDGSGHISCGEFLSTFFRLGADEQAKLLESKQTETQRMQTAEEERNRNVVNRLVLNARTRVVWPKLPPNDDDPLPSSASHSRPGTTPIPHKGGEGSPDKRPGTGVSLTPIDPATLTSTGGVGLPPSEMPGFTKVSTMRRMPVADIRSPKKASYMSPDCRFVDFFPKVSQDTKVSTSCACVCVLLSCVCVLRSCVRVIALCSFHYSLKCINCNASFAMLGLLAENRGTRRCDIQDHSRLEESQGGQSSESAGQSAFQSQ